MKPDQLYKIGYVSKTHGLKGGVTITFTGPLDSEEIEFIHLEKDGSYKERKVESFSARPDQAFVKLEGIDSIEAAEKLKGSTVLIQKSNRRKKSAGEFYDDEIIGFSVVDGPLGNIGMVTRMEYNSRQGQGVSGLKFLVVKTKTKEILIPAGKPFIEKISLRTKKIHTTLPDGFLDI